MNSKAVRGWVLYDFANVIFSMNIVSIYFPLWVVNDAGGRDADYGVANSISMLFVFLLAPLIGTLMDKTGRRKPVLMASTLICVVMTALLGLGGLTTSLLIFALANAAFGCGLVAYDALLAHVSTPLDRGKIGGYGIAAGFGGALLGVAVGIGILAFNDEWKPWVFGPQLRCSCSARCPVSYG